MIKPLVIDIGYNGILKESCEILSGAYITLDGIGKHTNEFLNDIYLSNKGIHKPAPIFNITTEKYAYGWQKK